AGPNFKCSGRAFGGTSRASGGSVRRDPEGTRSCAHSGAAAAASASTASTRGVCGPDISVPEDSLDLEVLLEPEHPVLAAVARLAVAAERGMTRPGRVVDVHLPRADPACHAARGFLVGRLDVRTETVDGGVGDADRVLLIVVGHQHQHRAKDFLLRDAHLRRHLREYRRPREIAAVEARW